MSEKGKGSDFRFSMECQSADQVQVLDIKLSLHTIKEDGSEESGSSDSVIDKAAKDK